VKSRSNMYTVFPTVHGQLKSNSF